MGEVDGFADGAADKRLSGGHHADVAFGSDEALAEFAAFIGAVEDGEMLVADVWGTFDGLRAADERVELVDGGVVEPEFAKNVETGRAAGFVGVDADAGEGLVGECPGGEGEGEFEDAGDL